MTATRLFEPKADLEEASLLEHTGQDAQASAMMRAPSGDGYVLTLYVASLTPRSVMAIQSVKEVCEKHLRGQYCLEVVDIYERPSLAKHDQILAAPTLIKRLPLPLRRLIGDMADEHRVLVGLDLRAREGSSNPQD
jgi:circadian clock protein KaiB